MRYITVLATAMFFFIKADAQKNVVRDSLKSIEVQIDPIELIHHPIQKHFLYSQNKLEINQASRELAATFDDPSRVLYRHVGLSLSNDQSNAIVYRGLPSEFTKWSINGAEIVNPNHLSNAGRISDQSSPSAGGVLAIPFEVVNKFSFYGNPYGPQQVNALSGVADFNFDIEGDNFFKVGLLGMEAGFQKKLNDEGSQKIKGDFRYSTVGLLSDFGVNFDGEAIKFYDGFIKADLSNKLSIIAIAGNSTNYHEAATELENVSQIKDLQQINFKSKFFIAGITYNGDKYNHSFFVSKRNSDRTSDIDDNLFEIPGVNDSKYFSRRSKTYSYNGFRKFSILNSHLLIGTEFTINNEEIRRESFFRVNIDYTNLRPYANYKYLHSFGKLVLKLEPGISLNIFSAGDIKMAPSLFGQIAWGSFLLDLNYAKKIRYEEYEFTFGPLSFFKIKNNVETISTSLKYVDSPSSFSVMFRLFETNINTLPFSSSSVINGLRDVNMFFDYSFVEDGIQSKGIEFMMDKSWENGWYLNLNFTLFDASYSLNDTVSSNFLKYRTINTNENFKSIYNFVASKEIINKKKNRWVFNLAYHQRGGAYENIYNEGEGRYGDERRLATYYRVDARFQYNWNKKNTLTLDIQNVTNRLNEGFYYYDAFLDEEVLQYQLGTIPILSYKRIL